MADFMSRKLIPLWMTTFDDDHSPTLLLKAVNTNLAMVRGCGNTLVLVKTSCTCFKLCNLAMVGGTRGTPTVLATSQAGDVAVAD